MKKRLLTYSALVFSSAIALTSCSLFGNKKGSVKDEYVGDRLVLNLRNLYFEAWDGSDTYTEFINDKFKVQINPTSYVYDSWDEQVSGQVNANNIGDVFHYDLESFNFGNTYLKWSKGLAKPLPDDLSQWPNIKNIIDHTSNIDKLKLNGKIYGLPIAYNKNNPDKTFSSFTYVYRRDLVKKHNAALLRDNDVYTWEEFQAILDLFGTKEDKSQFSVIGDASWGFPSLTNFYKDSPHCYSVKNGQVRNAFTTPEYEQGLTETRKIVAKDYYFDQVSNANNTQSYTQFRNGKMGVYYENLSYSNYAKLRRDIKSDHPTYTEQEINDRTAIMKVKGPDGKFHLEGSENWFSMTIFNNKISDTKFHKILDVIEYLLTEEGTRLAIYGKENRDYIMVDGEPELIAENWPKQSNGQYATKINGAKYLRNMITLGNDTTADDPFTDLASYNIISAWQEDMKAAKIAGNLVTFEEPANIKWMSTTLKDRNTSALIEEGNTHAMNFCYSQSGYSTLSDYEAKFAQNSDWAETIQEIQSNLH